jgi:peptide/nickel transport system substrate-binding protein
MRVTAPTLILFLLLSLFGGVSPAPAAPPDGTLAIGVHVTLVSRWLDPGETEALITPFMVLYTLHDALLKPMPGNINAPSLAESWTLA